MEEKGENERPALPAAFPAEEIEAEERRPKRKVAVMIGYSGTGYKGMQIDNKQKTIEGDLFNAFVAAGAISKANAVDPKKVSLVRCARTDKGVHAAGNVVSLKLIIEDEDIVDKINSHLTDQIRVWGIQRTVGSFSCYQACDSRWYEYLIPTHSFLPPHPSSFLGKKLEEFAEKENDLEGYRARQAEVANFWPEVEEKHIKPILDSLDDSIRPLVQEALYNMEYIDAPAGEDRIVDASIEKQEAEKEKAADGKDTNMTEAAEETAKLDASEVEPKSQPSDEAKEVISAVEQNDPSITLDSTTDGTRPLPPRRRQPIPPRRSHQDPQENLHRHQKSLPHLPPSDKPASRPPSTTTSEPTVTTTTPCTRNTTTSRPSATSRASKSPPSPSSSTTPSG
ncbi:TruA, Pseudouridylate synthase [Pyrenophora tritici-repentis]|uniref:TruA, Pseudouridylate synthase n=1 Tax=Pyrenophora tritici-repentis TaxID=45151 RepID=A0A316ZRD6_9PLEO|nr:TruA, Pseudouridylate synthase [Pyrenophora tritici-repentis]